MHAQCQVLHNFDNPVLAPVHGIPVLESVGPGAAVDLGGFHKLFFRQLVSL